MYKIATLFYSIHKVDLDNIVVPQLVDLADLLAHHMSSAIDDEEILEGEEIEELTKSCMEGLAREDYDGIDVFSELYVGDVPKILPVNISPAPAVIGWH